MTTVVFADLVGSTGLYERLGDADASRFVTHFIGALSHVFLQHRGRVVKLLGDGLFAAFESDADALAACVAVQQRLRDRPLRPTGAGEPVNVQIGLDSGEVVEISGDCFGDVVNSAARLAGLAGSGQILATQAVREGLPPSLSLMMHGIGPVFLRGKSHPTEIFRVDWSSGREDDRTMMSGSSAGTRRSASTLVLRTSGQELRLEPRSEEVTLGRAADAAMVLNDRRVSRAHASISWRGTHFVITDRSSFGTWLYFGSQTEAMVLRRSDCTLIGDGQIVLGCPRDDLAAPLVTFSTDSSGSGRG